MQGLNPVVKTVEFVSLYNNLQKQAFGFKPNCDTLKWGISWPERIFHHTNAYHNKHN